MNTKTRYLYLYENRTETSRGNPVAVVAYITVNTPDASRTRFAYAVAHPRDEFNKTRGRKIAEARLLKDATSEVVELEADARNRNIERAMLVALTSPTRLEEDVVVVNSRTVRKAVQKRRPTRLYRLAKKFLLNTETPAEQEARLSEKQIMEIAAEGAQLLERIKSDDRSDYATTAIGVIQRVR